MVSVKSSSLVVILRRFTGNLQKEKKPKEEAEPPLALQKEEENLEEIDQHDDGYIELVLRVLARMCDGQHKGLQVTRTELFFILK